MKRLIAILLCTTPAFANEPPHKPLAVCDQGVCTMSEADYETFRRFHRATFDNAMEQGELIEALSREVASLRAKLARTVICEMKAI